MIEYVLPEALEVNGCSYAIRSDFRAALDIFCAFMDPELSTEEKALVALEILYADFPSVPEQAYPEALEKSLWFLNGGTEERQDKTSRPQLVDWEKDFPHIAAPVSRVLGRDVRGVEKLHWWSFLSAYYEIGDCTFAQIVRIRKLKAEGKKLDKSDADWYAQNRDLVDIKTRYTEREEDLLAAWAT